MAALNRLADVCETFEDTWAFEEKEFAEGDLLLAEGDEAMDQLAAAQQHCSSCSVCRSGGRESEDH